MQISRTRQIQANPLAPNLSPGRCSFHPYVAVTLRAGAVTTAVVMPEVLAAVIALVAAAAHRTGLACGDILKCLPLGRHHPLAMSGDVLFAKSSDHVGQFELIGHDWLPSSNRPPKNSPSSVRMFARTGSVKWR